MCFLVDLPGPIQIEHGSKTRRFCAAKPVRFIRFNNLSSLLTLAYTHGDYYAFDSSTEESLSRAGSLQRHARLMLLGVVRNAYLLMASHTTKGSCIHRSIQVVINANSSCRESGEERDSPGSSSFFPRGNYWVVQTLESQRDAPHLLNSTIMDTPASRFALPLHSAGKAASFPFSYVMSTVPRRWWRSILGGLILTCFLGYFFMPIRRRDPLLPPLYEKYHQKAIDVSKHNYHNSPSAKEAKYVWMANQCHGELLFLRSTQIILD